MFTFASVELFVIVRQQKLDQNYGLIGSCVELFEFYCVI